MAFFWHLVLDNAGFLTPTMQEMSSIVPAVSTLRSAYQLRNALQPNWDEVVLSANPECLERHLREDLSPRLEDPTLYTDAQRILLGRAKLRQGSMIRQILRAHEDRPVAQVEPELWPDIIDAVANNS